LLWMRSRANRAEHRRRFRSRPGIDATGDDADYCCSAEGSAMSAVNHQFRLAVGLAETFASASRTLSGWVRVSSRSPTPNRSRERGRSPGKPPLSDDDQWPLCAISGHSGTAWRRGQVDLCCPSRSVLGTAGAHQIADVGGTRHCANGVVWNAERGRAQEKFATLRAARCDACQGTPTPG